MTPEQLLALARKTPNRGRCHIFLGHPLSDTCDKTTVEPGNFFSPGVWTCGISLWVEVDGKAYAAEALDEAQVAWHFGEDADGLPPVVTSEWAAGPVTRPLAARAARRRGCGGLRLPLRGAERVHARAG